MVEVRLTCDRLLAAVLLLAGCPTVAGTPIHPDQAQDASSDVGRIMCETDDDCDDVIPCTLDACGADGRCISLLIDADRDGFAALGLGACGTDCDDDVASVHPGAFDGCDGEDTNCDGSSDEDGARSWFVDCDGDSFAVESAAMALGCDRPSDDGSCGWTLRAPNATTNVDCDDGNELAFPLAASFQALPRSGLPQDVDFDYDCDGVEEREFGFASCPEAVGDTCTLGTSGYIASGGTGTGDAVCGEEIQFCLGTCTLDGVSCIPEAAPFPAFQVRCR